MKVDKPTTRVWAAVLDGGHVTCLIRDFICGEERWDSDEDTRGIRWYSVVRAEAGEAPNEVDGRNKHDNPACGPGKPCLRCIRQARGYWVEYVRRVAGGQATLELGPEPRPGVL